MQTPKPEKKSGACCGCYCHGDFAILILDQRSCEYQGLCESCAPIEANGAVRELMARYAASLEVQ